MQTSIDWSTSSVLTNLTHLDGRNAKKLLSLRPLFSELAWMKERIFVMGEYVTALVPFLTGRPLSDAQRKALQGIAESFSTKDARLVGQYEQTTNHDLKALELFYASRFAKLHLTKFTRYINLGLGSEDINSIALAAVLQKGRNREMLSGIATVARALGALAKSQKNTMMVARTHGQPANVTTLGKEIANSLSRLCDEVEILLQTSFTAKCSGEVGSYQAFLGIDPTKDWLTFTDSFIRSLGLRPTHSATQIAPYDGLTRFLQSLFRVNAILLDFVKNMWLYVLLGYFRVKVVEKEVGSAGMPHKVNPIYFEGAEGGLETANGVIELLARKLPINRLQRDFSDSTMRRNIVLVYAYSMLSYQSIIEGMKRIDVDGEAIATDVDRHGEIWIELVKSFGLAAGYESMYDVLKRETRGREVAQSELTDLVSRLPFTDTEKKELRKRMFGQNLYLVKVVDEALARLDSVFPL